MSAASEDRGMHRTSAAMGIAEYDRLDAVEMAALVRARQIDAAELLEEAIARAERVNPRINAIVRSRHERARDDVRAGLADGPLRGVPFLLKDLHAALAGEPLSSGSRYMADYRPTVDATIVARYRKAGLVVFGQTNTPEIGLLPYTEPALFGPTRNPWDAARTPGGSSGGSAAAVAAGIVPAAHASDGGGSIRIPSSCCGLFGLKPTRGRTPVGPEVSEVWSGLAVEHAVSRSVRDSAALLDAVAGPEPGGRYQAPRPPRPFLEEVGAPPGQLRIAITRRPYLSTRPLHPDCVAAADDAAKLLADLGHHVDDADLGIDADQLATDFFLSVCVEMANAAAAGRLLMGRRARRGDFETGTAITVMIGRQQTALAFAQARDRLSAVTRQVARAFETYDLLLSPTLGRPPPEIGTLAPRGIEAFGQSLVVGAHLGFVLRLPGVVRASIQRIFQFIPFTPLANVTGQPAMSVPLYWNAAGLPVGTMLSARFGDEATLFRLAAQLEAARPWRDRRPPIHASLAT
jgi:amidase